MRNEKGTKTILFGLVLFLLAFFVGLAFVLYINDPQRQIQKQISAINDKILETKNTIIQLQVEIQILSGDLAAKKTYLGQKQNELKLLTQQLEMKQKQLTQLLQADGWLKRK